MSGRLIITIIVVSALVNVGMDKYRQYRGN